MEKLLDILFSAESIAVVAAIFIFIVAIMLFVKKLINFLMTMFLLVFCIAAGLAIANYDYFKKAYLDENSQERDQVENTWEQIKDKVQYLYESLPALTENLKDTQIHVEAFRSSAMMEINEIGKQVSEIQATVSQGNKQMLSLESNLQALTSQDSKLDTAEEEYEERTNI